MKTKWLYFAVAAVAVAAVVYPVAYAQFSNQQTGNNPYQCTPFIPCAGPTPGFEACGGTCIIYMVNSTFVPGTVNVTVGTTITWVNHDGFGHTSTAYNSTWNSPPIGPGQSYSITVGKNFSIGSYYYHCNVHPSMIGLVNVVASA